MTFGTDIFDTTGHQTIRPIQIFT